MVSAVKLQELVDEKFSKKYLDSKLKWIFVLVFYCSVMVNVDHGTLPGCSVQVIKKLEMKNIGYGALGTVVYIGLSIGSAVGTKSF